MRGACLRYMNVGTEWTKEACGLPVKKTAELYL